MSELKRGKSPEQEQEGLLNDDGLAENGEALELDDGVTPGGDGGEDELVCNDKETPFAINENQEGIEEETGEIDSSEPSSSAEEDE